MGSTPSPPQPTNPSITAAQQQQLNLQATEDAQAASNVNQITPQGSLTYQQTGTGPNGIPLYTATQTLTPAQQGIFNALQGGQQGAASQAGGLLNNTDFQNNNIVGNTDSITNSVMNNELSFLNPFFNQQTSWLDNQLRNQGLMPGAGNNQGGGGTAYGNAMQNLGANQAQQAGGFLAQIEPQAFQQAVTQYQLPASTAGLLMSLAQGTPLNQSTVNTPQATMQPANLIGATANAQNMEMQAYNAQLANQASMMSGIFGGLGAIGGGLARNPAIL